MTELTFDFDFANTSCIPFDSVITKNKDAAIQYYSKVYEKYHDRINKEDGKILIGYSEDGSKINAGQVECSPELFFEIYSGEEIIKELSKNKTF